MGTIALIMDFIADDERTAVIDRYTAIVNAATASNNTAELGKLLVLAVYWNGDPGIAYSFRITINNQNHRSEFSMWNNN